MKHPPRQRTNAVVYCCFRTATSCSYRVAIDSTKAQDLLRSIVAEFLDVADNGGPSWPGSTFLVHAHTHMFLAKNNAPTEHISLGPCVSRSGPQLN